MILSSVTMPLLDGINRDLNCSNLLIKTMFIDDIDPTSISPEQWCSFKVGSCIDHQRYFVPLQTNNKDGPIKFPNSNVSEFKYRSLFLFIMKINKNNTHRTISNCFLPIESLVKFNNTLNASRINENVENNQIESINHTLNILRRLKRKDDSNPGEDSTNTSLILPVILLVPLLTGLIILIFYSYIENITSIEPEPEVQENMIHCMEENALYHYKLIFRVGCPTDDFNMKRSFVDFEILGHKDEIIGSPIR